MESNRHSETPSEISSASGPPRGGGGERTSLLEANGDAQLVGVAFSRLG